MKPFWKKALPLLLCLVTLLCLAPVAQAEEAPEMKVSEEFVNVLKEMEGFSAKPYWDVSQWTIGYGTKCPSDKLETYKKTGITEKIALELLDKELAGFCEDVNNFAKKHDLKLKQNQFDALVSFTYNCGASWMGELNGNFNTAVRSGDMGNFFLYGICLYSSSAGNYILIKRRLCEANMYINGVYKAYNKGDSFPSNYKWVFLNGGGAMPRYPIYAYDAKNAAAINIRFSDIPTGKTADGDPFVYEFAGWYTEAGKKVSKADSSLENGQVLYARWKDPDGKVVELPTGTPVAKQKVTVTSSSANMRKGPGTYYDKTGTQKKGATLTLTETYKVGSTTWGNTNKGWVSLSNTDYETTPEVTFPQNGAVNANDVNYRSGPGTGYKKKGEKDKGDKVTIVELNDNGKWGKMSDGNWIFMEYVTYDKDKVTKVELLKKPTILDYESYKKPLMLEGSVVRITYADGRQEAQTIARSDVKDNRTATSTKATVTATYGSKSVSFTITFGSGPVKIKTQPKNASANIGDTAKVTVKASGEGLKYRWYIAEPGSSTYKKTDVTTASYSLKMDSKNSGSKVYCKVTDKYDNSVKSKAVTLTCKVAITKQPANASVTLGKKITATVKADGVGLKYQWYYADPGKSYKKSGSTGTTYSTTMKESCSGRKVYCVVTDKYGNTAKTKKVTLTAKVTITKQPTGESVAVGSRAAATVKATGVGLKYQWYYANMGSDTFKKSSATGTKYSLKMKESYAGRRVYCVITDKHGNSVKSNVVTFTIKTAAANKAKITKQPTNASSVMGGRAITEIKATGKGLKYQWYYANEGSETFKKSSVTSKRYNVIMDNLHSGRRLYCVVTDKYGNSVKSKVVTLTSKVKITSQPKDISGEWGSKVKVFVKASGKGLKYQWYYAGEGSTTFKKSSVKSANYFVAADNVHCGRQLYCVVTDKYGNSVKTQTATITATVAITQQPEDVVAAFGSEMTMSVKANGRGLTYQWYLAKPGSDSFEKTEATTDSYAVTVEEAVSGSKAYCVITDKYGNSVQSETVTITGVVKAAITQQPADAFALIGNKVTASVEAEGEDLTYRWYMAKAGSDTFEKTDVTTKTYSATMEEAISGSRVYCVVKDRLDNEVTSNVATLTGVDTVVAETLREQMENRVETIEITYLQDVALPEENVIAVDVFEKATEHTGAPTQGDYLYHHIKKLNYATDCVEEDGRYKVTLTYTATYRSTAEQEEQVAAKVKEILDGLNVYEATDHEKSKAVYDYLCKNISKPYAVPGLLEPAGTAYTTYGALVENSAVCQGFASAFYRLMLELDVDVRVISGKIGGAAHGWNIVAIDDVYYNVDATKDAGFTPEQYRYFLKTDSSFTSHVRNAQFATEAFMDAYPMAEADYQ